MILAGTIFLLGLLLRLYRVDWLSLWHDEIFSVVWSERTIQELQGALVKDYAHPPLHYYLLHFWFKLAGYGAFQARLVSVLFGSLCIPLMYLLAKYLFGAPTGLIAAFLMSISQTAIQFSQEARPYAQFHFFFLFSAYLFLVALRARRASAWWGCVVFGILMVYTQWFGFCVLGAFVIIAWMLRDRYRLPWSWWFAGVAMLLALYTPWLASGIVNEAISSKRVMTTDRDPSRVVHWSTPMAIVNRYNNGKWFGMDAPTPFAVALAGALAFTMPALLPLVHMGRRSRFRIVDMTTESLAVTSVLLLFPLTAVLIAQTMHLYIYAFRHVSFGVAPYYLLVAYGLSRLRRTWRTALLVGIAGISVLALRSNYFLAHKESYRESLAYLTANLRSEDCVMFLPEEDQPGPPLYWHAYRPEPAAPRRFLRHGDLAQASADCPRLWIVWDKTWWRQRNPERTRQLINRLEPSWTAKTHKTWYGAEVNLYETR